MKHLEPRKRLLGLGFIFAVAVIWVVASFVVQGIEGAGVDAAVLSFIANSLFAVYLPIYWANLRLRHRAATRPDQERAALVPAGSAPSSAGAMEEPLAGGAAARGGDAPQMTWRQLLRVAFVVAPLWYLAQYTFNLSLAHTSVTSNTVLSSASSLFTFLLSVWLLAERFTLKKLACILLLLAGTAIYTLADTKTSGKNTFWGDLLVLASAVLYASYTITIRMSLADDEHTPMTLFFGLTGVVIFLGIGPLLLVLWLAGVGLGSLSWQTFGLVVAKGLLDNVLSDYLWARAILLVGPTVATAGLSMQVPIAVGLDLLFRHPAWLSHAGPAVLTLAGAALILAGFFGLNSQERQEEEEKEQAERAEGELHEVASHCELEGLGGRGGGEEEAPLSSPLPREGPLLEAAGDKPADAGDTRLLADATTGRS